jgi:exopolysaccharide production protein ExoZ
LENQKQTQPNKKIIFIHILRGFAPILVLFAHVPGLWLLERNQTWDFYTIYQTTILAPLRASDGGGQLGVILFFLISGYIISHMAAKESRLEFLIKRVFRIFPPLVVCTAIAFVLVRISSHFRLAEIYSTTAYDVTDFVKSAIMLSWIIPSPHALSVAWSLMPELIFYAFVLILIPIIRSSPAKSTCLMLVAYAFLTFPASQNNFLSYFGYFTVYIPIFIVGRVLYLERSRQITARQCIAFLLISAALFVSVYQNRFPDELFKPNNARIWNYPVAIAIFYGLMVSEIRWCPRTISFLADISYSLYLVHLPVGIFILNALADFTIPFAMKCCVAIGVSVVTAATINRTIERPAQQIARSLSLRFSTTQTELHNMTSGRGRESTAL